MDQFAFSNDGRKVWATVLPLSTIMHRKDCIHVIFMPYLQDLCLLRSRNIAVYHGNVTQRLLSLLERKLVFPSCVRFDSAWTSSVLYIITRIIGVPPLWTGSIWTTFIWTGSMDPLSWTGFMDSFFLIMRNEQKQKKCKNKIKTTTTTNNARLISDI